jgi:hypothetical protein
MDSNCGIFFLCGDEYLYLHFVCFACSIPIEEWIMRQMLSIGEIALDL